MQIKTFQLNLTQTNQISQKKINIQWYIFTGGIILFFIKILAFFLTNSVGILSDALESTVNVITGLMTLKSLQWATKPLDHDHPYGHGKIELITASVEGILIGIAGALIIIEAIKRLGTVPEIKDINVGIGLLALTSFINYLMGRFSIQKGKSYNSISLIAGGKHLISDTYTTVALIGGLLIFYLTGLLWLDSAIAIIFGLFIIYTAYTVLRETITGLLDEADINAINQLTQQIIDHKSNCWVNIHRLTYLKFGHVSHVDLHLTLPWYYNVRQSTEEIVALKNIIKNNLPEEIVEISIQSEPCMDNMCHQCNMDCIHRKEAFEKFRQWDRDHVTGKNQFVNH
jgi:cation diffusion facilitator family transporter